MGKKTPKAPAAPDPVATSAAQTSSNRETAYYNALLNNVNTVTPYGSVKYYNEGTEKNPQFRQDVVLSEPQQKLLDKTNANQNKLLDMGTNQLGRINNAVSSPFSYSGAPSIASPIDMSKLPKLNQIDYNTLPSVDGLSYEKLPAVFGDGDTLKAQSRAENAIYSRMNPQFDREEATLRDRLLNQGITQGSEAYQNEFNQLNQSKNDARQQAILTGQQYGQSLLNQSLSRRQQAVNEAQSVFDSNSALRAQMEAERQNQFNNQLTSRQQGISEGNTELQNSMARRNQYIDEYATQRNAPLNEYTALTSGTQIQSPSASGKNYQGAPPADVSGNINQNYQNQMAQYNARVAGRNQMMGNIFGVGTALATGGVGSLFGSGSTAVAGPGVFNPVAYANKLPWSDIRLKRNITKMPDKAGHKMYRYQYLWNDAFYEGVMAQDVIKTNPNAVHLNPNGFYSVDYDALGLNLERVA